jgi:hypothetical protein
MLIETLVICSLIINAPYYDCDETWQIYIFDIDSSKYCKEYKSYACAKWFPKRVYIGLNHDNSWVDTCGHKLLLHELNHLKYLNGNYCH